MADDWDIDVERSGGFAGITRRANASTGELPEADATQLAVLASAVDFDRYAHQAPHTGRPDAFQYQLKVRHGAARREFVVGEHETDPALAALIAWVLGRAPAPRPPGS